VKKIKKSANSMDEFWILNFLFVFFLSLINSTFYVFFRQNLEIHFSLPIIAIFILIISTLSPIVIKKKIKFKNHTYNNLFYPLVALLIFLLPILGNFYKEIFYLYIFLFILILFNFKLFLNISVNLNQIIKLFILAFLLSIFLINSINESNHAHFFSTEQMDLGVMNHDTRFHIALTHIIQNFNISSLGTHGYIPLNLHVFANWYFASFGNFLNLDPVWVVSGIPFFLIIPIFFFFLFNSSASLNNYSLKIDHIILNIIFIILILNLSGPFRNSIFISETYLIAITTLLALIPSIFELKNKLKNNNEVSLFCLFLIMLFPIIVSMKVSVGLFYGIFISWIIFKSFGIKKITFFYGFIIFFLFIVSYKYFFPSINDYVDTKQNPIDLFFYFKTFPGMYAFVTYFFIFLLIFLSSYKIHKINISNILSVNSSKYILIEGIIIIALIGFVMAIIGIPRNSSVWYFVNPCQWFTIPLIVSYILNKKESLLEINNIWKILKNKNNLIKKSIFAFSFFILLSFYFNTALNLQPTKFILKEIITKANNLSDNSFFKDQETPGSYFKKNLKDNFAFFDENFSKVSKKSIGNKLKMLNTLNDIDQNTAVYIDPNEVKYWEFQKNCRTKFHIVPSVSGLATLHGSPPINYGCGIDDYTANFGEDTFSKFLNDKEICFNAREVEINTIIKLSNFNKEKLKIDFLNCN
jgi:hypothetical protein